MKLLQVVYERLSDISLSCLCLSTKVIIVFKNNKIHSYIFIHSLILAKLANKIIRPSIKKQL